MVLHGRKRQKKEKLEQNGALRKEVPRCATGHPGTFWVTDRIVLHKEPCPCGNPSPWLEVEGRNDDVLCFTEAGQEIRVPPLAVYAKLKEVPLLHRFQVVKHHQNRVELRLIPMGGTARAEAFAAASAALRELFAVYSIMDIEIFLSEEPPKQHPISGKFKHIMNA